MQRGEEICFYLHGVSQEILLLVLNHNSISNHTGSSCGFLLSSRDSPSCGFPKSVSHSLLLPDKVFNKGVLSFPCFGAGLGCSFCLSPLLLFIALIHRKHRHILDFT